MRGLRIPGPAPGTPLGWLWRGWRAGGPEVETPGSTSHDFTAGILLSGLRREGKPSVKFPKGLGVPGPPT